MMTWKGKRLDDMAKDELIVAFETLARLRERDETELKHQRDFVLELRRCRAIV